MKAINNVDMYSKKIDKLSKSVIKLEKLNKNCSVDEFLTFSGWFLIGNAMILGVGTSNLPFLLSLIGVGVLGAVLAFTSFTPLSSKIISNMIHKKHIKLEELENLRTLSLDIDKQKINTQIDQIVVDVDKQLGIDKQNSDRKSVKNSIIANSNNKKRRTTAGYQINNKEEDIITLD